MDKTQLQNISLNNITNAVDTNHTTTELADTSKEHIFNNIEDIVGSFLRLSCKYYWYLFFRLCSGIVLLSAKCAVVILQSLETCKFVINSE